MAIKLAVSRCLLGDKVRYDGTDKYCANILSETKLHFEIIPFCPEMAIGMGVPRLPIRLDKINEEIHARRICDADYDYTEPLSEYALQFSTEHPDLKGLISKKGSPSCGYLNAKLFHNDKVTQFDESGIFIAHLLKLIPHLLIIDEVNFEDVGRRSSFLNSLKQKSPE